ncbi:hypothetical protein [Chiayiivirga flava]|uniref:P/Homo B domain-containing protein n=1 Tax=Chiayiivirga flava TaxID=659595 RepID=A0A7W8D5W5_9GAMM|nr:hypothetical protein [Chiayiivirga flava]MBB5207287.1 hypothetical protein [Chiayiivirga flava]
MKVRSGAARAAALLLSILSVAAGPAVAIAPVHEDSTHADAPVPTLRAVAQGLEATPALLGHAERSILVLDRLRPFQQRHGADWEVRWDLRADRPNVVQGSGIPLLPGSGNRLDALQGAAAQDVAAVGTQVRALFDTLPDLLRLDALDLRLDTARSGSFGPDAALWFIELQQYHQGVPVDGAFAYARISHGNVVQFGTERVSEIAIDAKARQSREDALAQAWDQLAFSGDTRIVETIEAGELRIYPTLPGGEAPGLAFTGMRGTGYTHVLAWRFVFRVQGNPATWQVLFDSHAGRVIDVRDLNVNADATVTGGVYPTTNTDTEIVIPFPFAAVTNNGAKVTDTDGVYDFTAGTATTSLNGRYFQMNDTCGAISLSNNTDGNLALGASGGTDCVTPGVGGAGNTHASRTGFYHLTRINEKARSILPANAWLQTKVGANMNIVDVCNAGWNGSTVNFFRSGSGCSNTGEIAAVFLHEWGHGMDTNSGGAANENASGEAVGDTFAFLETRDACIGPNFQPGVQCHNCTDCTGVRDVGQFSTRGSATIARPSTITDNAGINCDRFACPYSTPQGFPYRGPMGFQGHCESLIAGGANWDLTQNLVDHYGESGWQRMDDIWYSSLVPSKNAFRVASGGQCNAAAQVDGCAATNWYTVYLAVNDDDGNLANGTPDACRIWDAFDAHGIACGTRPVCSNDAPDFTLAIGASPQRVCAGGSADFVAQIGAQMGFDAEVTLSASGVPADASATFTPNPVAPGSDAALQIAVGAATPAGSYPIEVQGTAAGSPGHSASALLLVDAAAPTFPTLTAPADRAALAGTSATFTWQAVATAATYRIDVARDAMFTDIVATEDGLTAATFTLDNLDSGGARYYWRVTAENACGDSATSAVFTFATSANIELGCRTPNLAIPDNNATGVSDVMALSAPGTVDTLQIRVTAPHSWVGDLKFAVAHAGTTVTVIDRPGVPGSTNGCDADDIDVLLDDGAPTPVETQCSAQAPAIGGVRSPNQALAGFAGHTIAGNWTINASDAVGQDTGTLAAWCLIAPQPPVQAYSVGGTVSALVGSGLVLSLNDGEELVPVDADGSYAFLTLIDAGGTYAVSVHAQPASPPQTCVVSNATGTVTAADVTDVDVSCAAATFSVTATVEGLVGEGLQLQLNGGEVLDVPADGSVQFVDALDDGESYSVAVATQPTAPSQLCSVANGNGIVDGADVTDVIVTCVTQDYTVGGIVSGLVGSGLVLAIDSGDMLSIAADGPFVFPVALEDGSSYSVTVATQPRAPVQRCTVAGGDGTLAGADATGIAIDCVTLPLAILSDGFERTTP